MKNVHLVITDLFLPKDFAAEVCAGLNLPALETLLARGASLPAVQTDPAGVSLEDFLCGLFSVTCTSGAPVAAISAVFDGLESACWLRADPVHVRLQREQVVLLPNVVVSRDEATVLCASLNEHFFDQGLTFVAPHPSRWYVKLDTLPDIVTVPLSHVSGRNIHGNLPTGTDSRRWHQVFNEIQMLLFAHPLNEAREARGEMPINSVWLWGAGRCKMAAENSYDSVSSDDILLEMLALAAKIPCSNWPEKWHENSLSGRQLLVWTGLRSALQQGDLAAWRQALQSFETNYAQPLLQALRAGKIAQLRIDILGGDSVRKINLTRTHVWSFWHRSRRLADYSYAVTHD
jgi:hypothetical protein